MKKLNLKISIILFILMILIVTVSNASYSTVSMSVEQEPVATIKFGENSVAERSIISKDLENKEITFQLKITNSEKALKPSGELMIILDNSNSMSANVTETQTRRDIVIESAKTLIEDLLYDNDNLKIGVVSFSSNTAVGEGTIQDASLVSNLTDNAETLVSAISNIQFTGPRTNLDSGITLAKQYFTANTDSAHKYVIILSDGVPNISLDNTSAYYSDSVIEATKTSLLSLSSITNNVFVVLTGIDSGSAVAFPATKTYDEIISEIFGTIANPTIGKFYYVTDDELEDTIIDTIYKGLLPVSVSLKDINLVDTFTKEIVNNFTYSIVKAPNYGTISTSIDTATNSITWNIPELKSGETAITQYKIKLKEGFSEDILDKVIDTHSSLSVTYTDESGKIDTKTSTVTPKIKLTEPVVETPAPVKTYPKTGISSTIFAIIGITLLSGIYFGIKNNKYKGL